MTGNRENQVSTASGESRINIGHYNESVRTTAGFYPMGVIRRRLNDIHYLRPEEIDGFIFNATQNGH